MLPFKKNMKGVCVFLCMLLMLALTIVAAAEGKKPMTLTCNKEEIVVSVGRGASLKVSATPYVAAQQGYTFALSDETVADVNQYGRVKGLKVGQCNLIITSKYDDTVSISVPVRVVMPVEKITLSAEPQVIYVGQTTTVVPEYLPGDATAKEAVFTSHNEKIATVDENGVVTAVGRGKVYITAKSKDGNASAKIAIEVCQQPVAVELTTRSDTVVTGKTGSVRAVISPRNANDASVIWTSSDENIATIDEKGRFRAIAPGTVVFTATCKDAPDVFSSVTVKVIRLAESVDFSEEEYTVTMGESQQLSVTVSPEDTDDKSVVYKSSNPKIVSVDENGTVTALAPGKVTITATAQDGSAKRGRCTVNVHVPLTSVSFARSDVRVGRKQTAFFTMNLEPKKASNKNMVWTSSDENIATVDGTTNKVRIRGVEWGRCQVTGVTEEGGYEVVLNVNVGSLRHAVTISSLNIQDGKPKLRFKNNSNMTITNVKYTIVGYDEFDTPVIMSTKTGEELFGEYELPLAPGESTQHGMFTFYHPSEYEGLQRLDVVITGWECEEGYYNYNGDLRHSYTIGEESREWSSYETELYQKTEKPEPTVSPVEEK